MEGHVVLKSRDRLDTLNRQFETILKSHAWAEKLATDDGFG